MGRGLPGERGHPAEHFVAVPFRGLVRAEEEGEDPDERRAEALRDSEGAVGPDQVGGEVVLDIDLADGRADGRDREVVLGQERRHLVDLLVGQVEHVDVPGAAELDVRDAEVVQGRELGLRVGVDLVGEAGQGPHQTAPWSPRTACSSSRLRPSVSSRTSRNRWSVSG